jgi:RimJ/RimL family protein N-acetyltransferase
LRSIGIFQPLDWPESGDRLAPDQPFWGHRFGTEAATAARDLLFGHFPLARVASLIKPDNHASKRVAERLGAVCEGTVELRGSTVEHWVTDRECIRCSAIPGVRDESVCVIRS